MKVLFDGKVKYSKTEFHAMDIESFYNCKLDSDNMNEKVIQSEDEYLRFYNKIQNYNFQTIEIESSILNIPKPILKRQKLKHKKSKNHNRIYYFLERFRDSLFPIKYNLQINSPVQFENEFYVWLGISKNDGEYGYWYFIKISKEKEVIDWCETSWEQ